MSFSFTKKISDTKDKIEKDDSFQYQISHYEFKDEDYHLSDLELKEMIDDMTITAVSRSPEEIERVQIQNYKTAIHNIVMASVMNDKAVLSQNDVSPKDIINKHIEEKYIKLIAKRLMVFAFLHGNITPKKYWIKITSLPENSKNIYISLPNLNADGHRSCLVYIFREAIGDFLNKGYDNVLISMLKRKGIIINKDKRAFCFPKGHLLASVKDIPYIRHDLGVIFSQLGKPIDQREFKLQFFNK